MPTLNYGDIRCDEKAGLKTGGCTLPSSVLANILRGQCACGSNPLAGVRRMVEILFLSHSLILMAIVRVVPLIAPKGWWPAMFDFVGHPSEAT